MERSIKNIALIFALSFIYGAVYAKTKKYSEKKAIVLQDKCILWQMDAEGKMVDTKKTLEVGMDVTVKADENLVVQTLDAEWMNNRSLQNGKFVKITYIDDDYYIFSGRIAVDMESAVITVPSAAVYKNRNLASVTQTFLPSGRVLAVGKKYDIAGGVSLSAVAFYDYASGTIVKAYVRGDKISSNRDDITAIAMLKEADDTYNLTKRRQIISAVKDLNVSGNVLEMIGEAEMRIRRSLDLSSAGAIDIASQVFYYDKKGDFIYIRDMPSTSGEVLGNLEYEEDFSVIRRTARSQTLYGTTDYWYYGVSAGGLDGWVYGGLLTPRPVEEDEEVLENMDAPVGNPPESSSENSSSSESSASEES